MGQAHFELGGGPMLTTKVAFDPRADDGRRLILLGRRTVTIKRRLRGVKMHLSVPIETYLGVVMAREGQPDGVLYRVTLAHPDPDLSVTLKESRSRGAMIEAWHHWSAYFAAPIVSSRPPQFCSRAIRLANCARVSPRADRLAAAASFSAKGLGVAHALPPSYAKGASSCHRADCRSRRRGGSQKRRTSKEVSAKASVQSAARWASLAFGSMGDHEKGWKGFRQWRPARCDENDRR
jgi:hypothetical protein